MTNRFLFVVFLVFGLGQIGAQTEVDSLKKVAATTRVDTIRVNTYLHFFFTDLFYDQPSEVIAYSHLARVLATEIGFTKGLVKAHNNLGYTYRTQSENDSAFYHYGRAVKKAESLDFYKGLTDAHIGIGNTHNQLGAWFEAIAAFSTVIDLAKKEGDSIQMASAHNNIGNTYLTQTKYEEALKNYQRAAAFGDASIRGVALINIAVVHNQMGNVDAARDYFQKGIEDAERLGKKGHLAFIYRNLGILEKKSANYEKSLDYYRTALEHYQKLSDDYSTSEIIQNMGNVYFEQKDFTKALGHYEQSLAIQARIDNAMGMCFNQLFVAKTLKELGQLERAKVLLNRVEICGDSLDLLSARADAAELMSKILKDEGLYEEALRYQITFKTLSDSIKGINSEERIAELETQYQTTQKESEIQLLSTQNEIANLKIEKQNNTRNFLIIVALILLVLSLALYSRYAIKNKAAEKLRELDALKSRFYTNISHEFRTPLTLILNPLDRLLNGDGKVSQKNEVMVAYRNAERLLELTNQMLDLSKLEAGKLNLQVVSIDLKDFITVTSASFESWAESKNISFATQLDFDDPKGYLDTDKLHKILNNLLSNAFKYTPSGGSVNFKAASKKGKLYLAISDTGDGFSANDQQLIFDRFHQVSPSQEQGGTGIGLTLTKELVLLHKGSIEVESQHQKGSTFSVEIPIAKDFYTTAEIATIPSIIQKQQKREKIHQSNNRKVAPKNAQLVLVVEDNEDLRTYLGNLLEPKYQVHFATNGQKGLEKAQKLIPDLIISDWMMPKMHGGQLCEAIKTDERTSHIPLVLLTAKVDQESKVGGLSIGADDYLAKPFDNQELLVRVENLIKQRETLRLKYAETLLVEPSKISIPDPDKLFLEKALEQVNTHITDSAYSVEQFQKAMGMSRMQLHRKLKALLDQSASEFIRNLRLQRAADMLSQKKLQVSEVAYQCGFNNLSYFGQCFKEKFGVSPSQYE